jgi:molybdopterin synthase catalytic subunit
MDVELTTDPIEYAPLVESCRSHASGAVVLFLGTVRDFSEGKDVVALDYDAYASMAKKKLGELAAEAKSRWPLQAVCVRHRTGRLELGDIAVAIVTASAHRAEAFAAAQWMMDTIKQLAPIWKRENWADGTSEWSHPSGGVPPVPSPLVGEG